MSLPEIKESTLLAVLSKATQSDPMDYCADMLMKHPESARVIAATASSLSVSLVGEDADMEEQLTAAVAISAAMFLTYESIDAEVEGKQLEDLFDA
jgi:hypothetical protein